MRPVINTVINTLTTLSLSLSDIFVTWVIEHCYLTLISTSEACTSAHLQCCMQVCSQSIPHISYVKSPPGMVRPIVTSSGTVGSTDRIWHWPLTFENLYGHASTP